MSFCTRFTSKFMNATEQSKQTKYAEVTRCKCRKNNASSSYITIFFCSFNLFLIYFVVVFSIHSIILATTYEIFMMLLWKFASFYSNFRFTIFYAKHNLFGWIVHYSVNMSKWLRRIPGNFMKIICMVFLKIFSTSKKCVFFKALE